MAKIFTVDVSKCNGCFNCQLACKEEHAWNDWTPYAKPQTEIGQFWLKLKENVCGTIPKVKIHYIPELCNHCDNAACMAACRHGAYYRREDGIIILDPEKCVGCRECQSACPYEAIYFNEERKICQKCTGCAHLLDNGHTRPRCVDACPTEALEFVEESEAEDFVVGATVRKPETGAHPRVYYRNIPGRFIAATVYDPVKRDVIEGAKVRATNGGKTYFTVTDEFGDFWFNDLAAGRYNVVIEAKGYETKVFDAVDAKKDVNLGDVPLEPSSEK